MPNAVLEPTSPVLIAEVVQVVLCLLGLVFIYQYWRRRHQPAALPRWSVTGTAFATAALFTLVVGILIQTALVQGFGAQSDTLWQLLVPGGGFQIGILIGAVLAAFMWLRTPPPASSTTTHTCSAIIEGIKTFMMSIPVIAAASLLWMNGLQALGIDAPQQELIGLFAKATAPGPFLALSFVAVILAPLTEETVFRGGIFRFARGRLPRWVCIIGSAALFAAPHANLASFFPLLMLGSLFALAYERTGRLIVPIVAHSLFNLNTILLVLCGVTK